MVFAALPFDVTILFHELDGTFPNHPADPIQAENLVGPEGGGRWSTAPTSASPSTATPTGSSWWTSGREPVSGSLTTALVAAAMLEKHPGATILYNLICSKWSPR